ncbi:MAG TPA: tyrosine-type recombinase/integrase [Acidothermaceae bacterium]|nr:tyrosine-type recombinase/integrase [Acidothermaceae bacterium]
MSALRDALADYLTMRRTLGYTLVSTGKLLSQFVTYLENHGEDHVTIENALAWTMLPKAAHRSWYSIRFTAVRRFSIHLHGMDPTNQVPPSGLLPGRFPRATPYLYSKTDVRALLTATATLRSPHRQATYRTLIALLAVTGMRVGEAIALDRDDFDAAAGVLTIRKGKLGKSRELPLHASTVTALNNYLHRPDRPSRRPDVAALLISPAGTRLFHSNVQDIFQHLVDQAGLKPRSAACRPRLHDFRHGLAVDTILDAYRNGGNPAVRLALLSTYLGHVDPVSTYWYLSAAPELMELAGERLERHLGGGT